MQALVRTGQAAHLGRFFFSLAVLVLLLSGTSCSMLPADEMGRRLVYERRLSRLDFPVTRQRLYKTLPPVSAPERVGNSAGSLLGSTEVYRLDEWFVVEMSVVYHVLAGGLYPSSGSVGSQVRAILDTTQSIQNLINTGTPEHRADIIQRARVVRAPVGR
jgi:hypothetical protein